MISRRLFCSFESLAVRELASIADAMDAKIDALGGDSVDLHDGVLTIDFPSGTFVINKHFASKQIWYSSPVSPPAYFEPERWWSEKLGLTLRQKLEKDVAALTGEDAFHLGEKNS